MAFLAMIALAGRHERFPGSFTVTGEIEVPDEIIALGGFADVKSGVYENRPGTARALRVSPGSGMKRFGT